VRRVDESGRSFAMCGATALSIVLAVAMALACERLDAPAPTAGPRDPAEQGHAGAAWETSRRYAEGNGLPKRDSEAAEEKRRHAASREYFIRWVEDNLSALERRNNYGSLENREVVRGTFMRGLEVFERLLAEARESD